MTRLNAPDQLLELTPEMLAGRLGIPGELHPYESPTHAPASPTLRPEFVNPIYEGADPWITRLGHYYYFCQTEGHDGIAVCRSTRLTDKGAKKVVWRPRKGQWNSRDIWAPELHHIQGCWYIYYTASNGKNENHRTGVLRATSSDPQGPYEDCGIVYTGDDIRTGRNNRWAIDATPLEIDGRLYLVWSGWPDSRDIQYLYIAPMKNPWTVSGNRVKLCANNCYPWERVNDSAKERGLHEGPQILHRHGRVFIVYSCSSSWHPTYKLSMLWMDENADPLEPSNWTKSPRPVFESTDDVFGVGHASFTTSPDGAEDWVLFHAKRSRKPGWERAVWAQPFDWTADGMPDFGIPLPPGKSLPAPSGQAGCIPGDCFRDSFGNDSWNDWVYYGHTRYSWIDNGRLNLGGRPGPGAVNCYRSGEKALVRDREWTDCRVQARVRLAAGRREVGILFRVQQPALGYDAQKGYFAGLVRGARKLVLGWSNGSDWGQLALVDCPISAGKWYTLRVEAVGELIQVYLDDVLTISVRDVRFGRGMAGLRVVDTHAEFDDFEVTAL